MAKVLIEATTGRIVQPGEYIHFKKENLPSKRNPKSIKFHGFSEFFEHLVLGENKQIHDGFYDKTLHIYFRGYQIVTVPQETANNTVQIIQSSPIRQVGKVSTRPALPDSTEHNFLP